MRLNLAIAPPATVAPPPARVSHVVQQVSPRNSLAFTWQNQPTHQQTLDSLLAPSSQAFFSHRLAYEHTSKQHEYLGAVNNTSRQHAYPDSQYQSPRDAEPAAATYYLGGDSALVSPRMDRLHSSGRLSIGSTGDGVGSDCGSFATACATWNSNLKSTLSKLKGMGVNPDLSNALAAPMEADAISTNAGSSIGQSASAQSSPARSIRQRRTRSIPPSARCPSPARARCASPAPSVSSPRRSTQKSSSCDNLGAVVRSSSRGLQGPAFHHLDAFADPTSYANGLAAALNGDTLNHEIQRMHSARQKRHAWLTRALSRQMHDYTEEHRAEARLREIDAKRSAIREEQESMQAVKAEAKRQSIEKRFSRVAGNQQDLDKAFQTRAEAKQAGEKRRDLMIQNRRDQVQDEARILAAELEARRRETYEEACRIAANRQKCVASKARAKDAKIETIVKERGKIWGLRQQTNADASNAMAQLQAEITKQRISSTFDVNSLARAGTLPKG